MIVSDGGSPLPNWLVTEEEKNPFRVSNALAYFCAVLCTKSVFLYRAVYFQRKGSCDHNGSIAPSDSFMRHFIRKKKTQMKSCNDLCDPIWLWSDMGHLRIHRSAEVSVIPIKQLKTLSILFQRFFVPKRALKIKHNIFYSAWALSKMISEWDAEWQG